jgi:beta-glucosidase
MKLGLWSLLAAVAATVASGSRGRISLNKGSPWPASAHQQAAALVAKMSLDDCVHFTHGYSRTASQNYVGDVPSLTVAGVTIPELNFEDGPQGVADGVTYVTAFPSALTVVASWDANSMYNFGAAMAQEQRTKGTNVLLGPMINLARIPWGGRNFESQGEDPELASQLVQHEIRGIQSLPGMSACHKHFVLNSQEYERTEVVEVADRRIMWELYYPAFAAATDAGSGVVMCSYNRVRVMNGSVAMTNDTYACENPVTLADLKDRLGFDGFVQSDWGATHSTVDAANNGLDQEMPDSEYLGDALLQAVLNGSVPESRVRDMATRILTTMYALGLMDNPPKGNLNNNATSPEHRFVARQLASNGTVLLKNEGKILPLNPQALTSVAVIGDLTTVTGGGSGHVIPPYIVDSFTGVWNAVNPRTPRPQNCTFYDGIDFYQPGNPSAPGTSAGDCCAQCASLVTCNAFSYQADKGTCWFKPDTSGRRNSPGIVAGICSPFPTGRVNVTYNDGSDPQAAAALAASADVAIVVVATTSSEGSDRANLSLPDAQNAYVSAVAAAQKQSVVVVRSPGAVLMPWVDSVPAILETFMPGQEAGNAMADVIFGFANPSGRLPLSFPFKESDVWIQTQKQYPGITDESGNLAAYYTEGLLMGYRWFDQMKIEPMFPFGHGLSYNEFQYSGLKVSGTVTPTEDATVSFSLTNTDSEIVGWEVPQMYIGYPSIAGEPPRVMRGFTKIIIAPMMTQVVSLTLSAIDCSIFDNVIDDWRLIPGQYSVYIGASSRDIRLTGTFSVTN